MTYWTLNAVFLVVTVAVASAALLARRSPRWRAVAITAVAVLLLTAVFDNVMIAAGLFTYPAEHLTGLRVGLAPIEDFAYPLCAAFLVPAVFALCARSEP